MYFNNKIESDRVITLPTKLIEDVKSLGLNKIDTNKAFQFIKIVEGKSNKKYRIPNAKVPIPNTFLKKMYSSRYMKFLTALKGKGIIECNEVYRVDIGRCKEYNIRGLYFGGDITCSTYVLLCRTLKKSLHLTEEFFLSDYSKLLINKDKLRLELQNVLDHMKRKKYEKNEDFRDIVGKVVFMDGSVEPRDMNLVKLKKKLSGTGNDIIKFRNKFYVGTEETFKNLRYWNVKNATEDVINKLHNKEYWARICKRNGRFDTIISGTHNYLIKHIMEDNDLVSIDLCNSQFAFLAHLLPDDRQYKLFKKLCGEGNLYHHLQTIADVQGKKFTKLDAITTLFMRDDVDTDNKRFMTDIFPHPMAWIKRFKQQNGNIELALTLQRLESDMFIRDMYTDIKSRGLFCLTKHDSFLVKKYDAELVRSIINDYFCGVNFKGTLKTTSK